MPPREEGRLLALELAALGHELSRLARNCAGIADDSEAIDVGTLDDLAERFVRWAFASAGRIGDAELVRELTVRHQAHQAWAGLADRLRD